MLTSAERQHVEERFALVYQRAIARKAELFDILDQCNEEELFCMKYLYAYMPANDLASYTGELFLKFVRHALKVRKLVPWGKDMDDYTFLNYVLPYRLSSENIEFYGEIFFNELYPRIQDKSLYEAVVEVDYWCFEKATYQTTNSRTVSPLGIIKNAYGRCGEEAVFAAAALRSVGIPTRQAFTPRWSHCDDNHAWVEAWVDGKWHFLGACEPEITLDRGWFQMPASRGMLIESRAYTDLVGNEKIVRQEDCFTEVNTLDNYAKTREVSVVVVDENGNPKKDILVGFEVINFSELFPLTVLRTNNEGTVKFTTGYGDLLLHAWNESSCVYEKLDVREQGHMVLILEEGKKKNEPISLTLVPPVGGTEEVPLTEEQKELHNKKNNDSLSIRRAYEATFYNEEKARAYAIKYKELYEDVDDTLLQKIEQCLIFARGNYEEVIQFLEEEDTNPYFKYKVLLLDSLQRKDLADCNSYILKEHLLDAMSYRDCVMQELQKENSEHFSQEEKEEMFVKYLLCPRIWNEWITPYRQQLKSYLSQKEQEQFAKSPAMLLKYLDDTIHIVKDTALVSFPIGAIQMKEMNEISKKVLFVAILRSIGIMSKIDPTDIEIAYYKDGSWIYPKRVVEDNIEAAKLILRKKEEEEFTYEKHYSVGIYRKGTYVTLDLSDVAWENNECVNHIMPGDYRIMVCDRQADGSIHAKFNYLSLKLGETKELFLELPKIEQQRKEIPINDCVAMNSDGTQTSLISLLEKDNSVFACLEVGKEPTEHLLNEIIEAEAKYNKKEINFYLFVKTKQEIEDRTLQKALKKVPKLQVGILQQEENFENIYKEFSLPDKKLPFVVMTDKNQKASLAWAGYQVGMGEMILKHLL